MLTIIAIIQHHCLNTRIFMKGSLFLSQSTLIQRNKKLEKGVSEHAIIIGNFVLMQAWRTMAAIKREFAVAFFSSYDRGVGSECNPEFARFQRLCVKSQLGKGVCLYISQTVYRTGKIQDTIFVDGLTIFFLESILNFQIGT